MEEVHFFIGNVFVLPKYIMCLYHLFNNINKLIYIINVIKYLFKYLAQLLNDGNLINYLQTHSLSLSCVFFRIQGKELCGRSVRNLFT